MNGLRNPNRLPVCLQTLREDSNGIEKQLVAEEQYSRLCFRRRLGKGACDGGALNLFFQRSVLE